MDSQQGWSGLASVYVRQELVWAAHSCCDNTVVWPVYDVVTLPPMAKYIMCHVPEHRERLKEQARTGL